MNKNSIKIAVHAGHAVRGARGASGLMDEVKMNRKLKKHLIKYLKKMGATVIDCTVHSGSMYKVLQKILYNFRKKTMSDGSSRWINVSIHLNAGGGHGTEIWTRKEDKQLADCLVRFTKSTGFGNRGVKTSNHLYVLKHLPNCQLWEVGFVDSAEDKKIYDRLGTKKIAQSMAESIMLYAKRKEK